MSFSDQDPTFSIVSDPPNTLTRRGVPKVKFFVKNTVIKKNSKFKLCREIFLTEFIF
jgi:hypothetical protein